MFFFFNDTATTEIYTLSLHDALPIYSPEGTDRGQSDQRSGGTAGTGRSNGHLSAPTARSEEHTSELQSLRHLVCRLLLEKKKKLFRTRRTKISNNFFYFFISKHRFDS